MTEVTVRSLGEEDWREFKAIRLAALRDSPDAFVASAEDEEAFEEDFWRLRVRRSTRFVAVRLDSDGKAEGQPVGVVSLGQGKDEEGRVAEIFGLWVAPDARGTGVATKLVEASAERRDATAAPTCRTGSAPTTAARWPSPAGSGSAPPTSGASMRVTPATATTTRRRSPWSSPSAMTRPAGRPLNHGALNLGNVTSMPTQVEVVWDPGFTRYDFGPTHPMSPVRLDLTARLCDAFGLFGRRTSTGWTPPSPPTSCSRQSTARATSPR